MNINTIKLSILVLWLLFFQQAGSLAQQFNVSSQYLLPEYNPVFVQNELTEIRVYLDQDSLNDLLQEENWYSDHEYPATFVFISSSLQDTVENVGFRLRGNTSRSMAKKSFKVSFNTFFPRKWNGLEKLNLNGNVNDPSLMRTKLCWDMMREAGLPGARVSYVKFYINDEFRGVYLNTEHIDENYVQQNFDQQGDGNLYKCLYPADLNYIGTNANSYKLEFDGRRVYDLKTNLWQDNYSDLSSFITAIENFNTSNGKCNFEKVFDIDLYLRYAALEVLQGHWDGYIYNKNNFYLYKNELSGKITWLPYDLDNTLGIDWVGENWSSRNIYQWDGGNRPLYELIMSDDEYRNIYSKYIELYATTFFTESWLSEKIDQYQTLIASALQDDPYFPIDFNFNMEDFYASGSTAWGGHVDYGIIEFANIRRYNALNQLESVQPSTEFLSAYDNGPSLDEAYITVETFSEAPVFIEYSINGTGPLLELQIFDDGSYPDNLANDHIFTFLQEFPEANFISYRAKSAGRYHQCETKVLWLTPSPSMLRINEVMSRNTGSYLDEFGESDDWIELNASGTTGANMSSMFLTDEYGNWNKWPLPSQIIPSGGFRIFWADQTPTQGVHHTNFRLSDNGETIWLIRYDQGAPRWVDAIYFPELAPNESFGRITEGSPQWVLQPFPTFNSPNGLVSVEEKGDSDIKVYPNPASEMLFISDMVNIQLTDMTGKVLLSASQVNQIDLGNFPTGLYLLKTDKGVFKILIE